MAHYEEKEYEQLLALRILAEASFSAGTIAAGGVYKNKPPHRALLESYTALKLPYINNKSKIKEEHTDPEEIKRIHEMLKANQS